MVRLFSERLAFPIALAACLLVGLTSSLLRKPPTPPLFEEITVGGGPLEPLALIAPEEVEPGVEIDFSKLRGMESFLFEEGESAIVYLGAYRIRAVHVHGEGGEILVALELEEGEPGKAILIRNLQPRLELHALIACEEGVRVKPLLKVVERGKLLEISGKARGVDKVEVYAYRAPEDFNASIGPSPKLYVTESSVVGGEYRVRMDLSGGPYTRRGRPLLEVNRTLVVYAYCTYALIDLQNVSNTRIRVDLECATQPPSREG
ncbi:MAG: hypothetical protein DRK00_11325 [Thermoprotei archaeon]|nr:MAG: hypothetical protein DRK00_11325 [Thermoprotei archaeon]